MDRKQAHAIYHQLYSKASPVIDDKLCQYCGVSNDLSLDHVPALTTAQLYSTRRDIDFILVDSCMECNQILSNQLLPIFSDRFFTVKEKLLKRYKSQILNEFRNGMQWDEDYLTEADKKFILTLDRIGFGLVRFTDLDDESQSILKLKVESYDETIGELISNRTGGGLLVEDNSKEVTKEDDDDDYCPYSRFLQIVSFLELKYEYLFNEWVDSEYELSLDYSIPESPTVHYRKTWSDIWTEALKLNVSVMPEIPEDENSCNLHEFIEILHERNIVSKAGYEKWFSENKMGAAIALDMPNNPENVYKLTWENILLRLEVYSKSIVIDDDLDEMTNYDLDTISKIDFIESLLTPNMIEEDRKLSYEKVSSFVREFDIDTEEKYSEFLNLIKSNEYRVHMPEDPKGIYPNWNYW